MHSPYMPGGMYGEPGASYADNTRRVDVLLPACSALDDDSEFAR